MRIALLHPTYWPEVQRGSERLIHDLGSTLVARGHDVTLLTTHHGRRSDRVEDGIRVIRFPRVPELPRIRHYEFFAANAPVTAMRLLAGDYDLAHAFFPAEGWAAVRARRLGGPPVVFSMHGSPHREYLVARSRRLAMLERTVRGAEQVTVLSEASAGPFRRYLLREPVVLPGGVRGAEFRVDTARDKRPTLFCAASLGDPRKRGALLMRAFERVRERMPQARLVVAHGRDPFLSHLGYELPAGAEDVGAESSAELARLYGAAWASVLPAVEEAFGLVLLESLAAGTPAIAARSGACPELIDDPRLGRLFDPADEDALVEAISTALAAPPPTDIAQACRQRAAEFEWDVVVERYLEVYERVLAG